MSASRTSRLIPAHAGKTRAATWSSQGPWAHPRSRGENLPVLRPSMTVDGSSPLTRGKRVRCWQEVRGEGLIPAHAGKTTARAIALSAPRAHPRSRGENSSPGKLIGLTTGSSPLTRGKPSPMLTTLSWPGLIPAHAGKTDSERAALVDRTAHPRSRGENNVERAGFEELDGSSPLTRGKRQRQVADVALERLIPAHAGKTSRGSCRAAQPRAHPRSRGENSSTHSLPWSQ